MQKEFERKAALSSAEFEALCTVLDKEQEGRIFTQENHYYDTRDLALKASSRTLRVRKIGSALTLEYKHGKTAVGDIRICTEDNRRVDALPPFIKASGIGESEEEIYLPLGVLTTERHEYTVDGATVALDKSTYLGVTDYEIEVETEGEVPLPAKLASLGIDFSKGALGKYHRFVKRLLELRDISK